MDFPGNIRELRNILERASLVADGDEIDAPDLALDLAFQPAMDGCLPGDEVVPLAELEQRYLARVAADFPGDREELARRLGISERTLYRKLQRIERERPDG
jgi:DNA-binding NtrC family response regulator